jgi:hypothetical protein
MIMYEDIGDTQYRVAETEHRLWVRWKISLGYRLPPTTTSPGEYGLCSDI